MNKFSIKKSKNSNQKASFATSFLAAVMLSTILLQPLAALADEPVIVNDENNVQNPVEQNVQANATDNVPVVTDVTYSTSTPPIIPPTQDPSATSTPTSTPDSINPEGNISGGGEGGSGTGPTTTPDSVLPPCPNEATTTPDSELATICDITTTEILNVNNLNATTTSTSTANTGLNTMDVNGDIKNATTTTGDVNVYANVLTIANINLVNSEIVQMNDTFNKLASDLYFNQTELTAGQRTQQLVSPICSSGNVSCESITTFKLSNQNNANVENDVTLTGNSGGNGLEATGDIKDSSIHTGNVNAVVNILNIVNANAINSHWTIVTFNVFGGWHGDLVMPSELYFSDAMSLGSQSNSDISQVEKVILNVSNTNDSTIKNNVTVQTDTGDNIVESIPGTNGVSGDIKNVDVTTGSTSAQSNVQNISNITVYNSQWFLGLINVMGNWSGHVYSLPSSVAMNVMPTGFTFVSSPDAAVQAALLAALQKPTTTTTPQTGDAPLVPGNDPVTSQNQQTINTPATGSDSTGTASSTASTEVDITNSNQATINNNVNVNAITGQNNISASGDIKNDSMVTGSATALANVLNFANANFINSDLYVGLINIFGDWQGNIVFGYPDLSLNQAADQTPIPGAANSPVNVNVNFANHGTGSVADSKLEWKFDPNLFALTVAGASSPNATTTFQTLAPGDIQIDLGKLMPNQTGIASFSLKTLTDQTNGPAGSFFARIFGNGPEVNSTDNQNTLTVPVATGTPVTTVPIPPANPVIPPTTTTGGGGSPGGSSAGSSNSGGSAGGSQVVNQIGIYPNILKVYKTNSAKGILKPGDKVDFVIIIDNDGINELNTVVLYDTLKDASGKTLSSTPYTIGAMAPKQENKITYSLVISNSATMGIYSNSAYAQGLDSTLHSVMSPTAISKFTVLGAGNQDTSTDTEKAKDKDPNATSTLATLGTITNDDTAGGVVLGDSCVQPTFKANLQSGSNNADVKALQVFLNNNGFVIAKKGAGSPGHETTAFGSLTKVALTNFQKKNGTKERGVFGAETRTLVNNLLNTSGSPFCPPPAPVVKAKPIAPIKPIAKAPVTKAPVVKKPVVKAPAKPTPTAEKPVAPVTVAPKAPPAKTEAQAPAKPGFWSNLVKHIVS